MMTKRNRIGAFSLLGALAGFLFVMFQPWIALDRLIIFRSLSVKALLAAFFDASLVGALADWFAVSALFKNPLGIKLPHTDILAKNKDAIAEAVPRFLTSFVNEEKILVELGRVDFAAKVEKLVAEGDARQEIHDFVSTRLSSLLSDAVPGTGARSESLGAFVRELFAFAGRAIDPAAVFAALLTWARRERLDEKIIEGAAELVRNEIGKNLARLAAAITPIIKRNAGWQGFFVGQGTVERLLLGVQNELASVRSNRGHELRRFLSDSLDSYAQRLAGQRGDPNGDRERFRASARRVMEDPDFQSRCADFIADILRRLRVDIAAPGSRFLEGLARIESALETQLGRNAAFRQGFNRGVAGLLSGLIARSQLIEGVTGYLATLLKSTDERDFVRRIEDAVWNDLQYIRVNGALVGGLVGLLLALFSALL
jgi:uncharacterized membrane-anchored protein YjiN (DUF445 family)